VLVSINRLDRLAWAGSLRGRGHPVVVEEVASPEAARTLIASSGPKLVMLDARGLDDPASAVAEILRSADLSGSVRVMIVGPVDRVAQIQRSLKNGASGYLFGTPRSVVSGVAESAGSRAAIAHVDPHDREHVVLDNATGVQCRLSKREVEVLQYVAEGMSNGVIAQALGLSAYTVKSHLSRIGRRLGTGDRGQMVYLAMRAGIVK
jgi:DNA-binding NarL/FixJ family response regulator